MYMISVITITNKTNTNIIENIFNNYNNQSYPNKELILIHVPVYFFVFMSFFLTIGLKFINSPSEDIYEIIKKHKKISEKNIILKIKKKNIIDLRINDLIQQDFITLKNRKLSLTKNGDKVSKFFYSLKKNLKVKCKG